jgi:hypothetical protein
MAAGLPCHTALEFFSKYPPLSGPCSSSIRVDLPSFAGYFPPFRHPLSGFFLSVFSVNFDSLLRYAPVARPGLHR